jgi:hypothetical protein
MCRQCGEIGRRRGPRSCQARAVLEASSLRQRGGRPVRVPGRRGDSAVLTVNSCIKVRLDLQADKSPVVVKGPFFPRVVNPRYQIHGTNV